MAQPDIHWQHEYGWEDRLDEFWDVYLTAEGNFTCCGSSQDRNNNIDSWLLIASDEGEQISSNLYDGEENLNETFMSLVETDDGGCFMGGYQYGGGPTFVFAFMVNEDCEELWQRSIRVDDNNTSRCKAVIEAKSGVYLMTGYTVPNGCRDGFLLALSEASVCAAQTDYEISSIILKGLNMNSHRRKPVECDDFKFQPRCCGIEQQSKQKYYPDELAMLFNEAGIEPLDKYVL